LTAAAGEQQPILCSLLLLLLLSLNCTYDTTAAALYRLMCPFALLSSFLSCLCCRFYSSFCGSFCLQLLLNLLHMLRAAVDLHNISFAPAELPAAHWASAISSRDSGKRLITEHVTAGLECGKRLLAAARKQRDWTHP
jgi:hypothetical protein